jgi:alkylation response protein AidB-like acyl-CoA dehydrogenase
MDLFGLDDDERVIAETAAAFAEKRLAPYALEWDATKHFPIDVLREAAELGMAAIYCRDDVGGSELRRLDAVRIFEKLSTADPTVAAFLSIHNMCAWMVDTYGTDEQRKAWVPRMASMESIASYCLTEPGAGSDASALRAKAVRAGSGQDADFVLDGVKQFISGAGQSDVYVVMARTGDPVTKPGPRGISAFLVEKDTPGLSFGANEAKMGWNAQPTAQVIFENVRVPPDAMLGGAESEGTGFGIAMNGLNGGRINIAACSLGGAQAAYGKSAAYVRDREAFGGALLDEPTIRFTLADMATALEASRNLLWRAARALDENHPDKVELCAMAKRYVTDSCFTVADQALQLHGGYGYLNEYGLEKIVRDLRVHRILEGTNEIMRVVIGRSQAAKVRARPDREN